MARLAVRWGAGLLEEDSARPVGPCISGLGVGGPIAEVSEDGGTRGGGRVQSRSEFLDQLVVGTLVKRAWPGRREPRRWIPLDGVETEGSAPKKKGEPQRRDQTPPWAVSFSASYIPASLRMSDKPLPRCNDR